jgi:O-acetyl-ADP-ribose deacetylase (regulator of RNase III)
VNILAGGNRFRILQGDLLQHRDAILTCPVNCISGVVGKGLALQFAKRYPKLKERHQMLFQSMGLKIHEPCIAYDIVERPFGMATQPIILFPTKRDWRDRSEYSYVFRGLANLLPILERELDIGGFTEIVMPSLGCGCGGLDPRVIHGMIASWTMCLPGRYSVSVYHTHESRL